MGYTTKFRGRIELQPPLTPEQVTELTAFSDTRHGGSIDHTPEMPGFWCDLCPSADGTSIGWNGNEKSYDMVEWMRYLIANFLERWGITANGELLARGEEFGDDWTLRVENNMVSRYGR